MACLRKDALCKSLPQGAQDCDTFASLEQWLSYRQDWAHHNAVTSREPNVAVTTAHLAFCQYMCPAEGLPII